MALKTFNINEEIYKEFSEHCKKHGISMSKKIENFLKKEIENLKSQELKYIDKISQEEHSFKKYC